MYKLILLLIPLFIYGDSLKTLLEYAHNNNQLIESKKLSQKSKQKEINSKESAYYPTLDIGAFYQSLDERNRGMAGDTYSGFAKIGLDIYDGGKKAALLEQKVNKHKASKFDVEDIKINVSLQIIQNFFNIKSLESTLASKKNAQKSLKSQLDRMNAFYKAELATSDDVDRLQSAYDTNIYDIESIKLQILSLKLNLTLQVGKKVQTLKKSKFKEDISIKLELSNNIKSLAQSKKALKSFSQSIDSVYYPQIRIEDTYSVYGYDNTDLFHPEGVDNQNKIIVSANIRLYDNATIAHSKQALKINAQSIDKQIEYKTLEQKMLYELSIDRIKANKIKIKSASSALKSATSAFNTIEKKYTAGIVDNVIYLDALVSKTKSSSLYETSLNDLQIAYGIYYYYAGKNLKEFLND